MDYSNNDNNQEQEQEHEDFKYDVHHEAPLKRSKDQCQGKVSRPKLESLVWN